ncbi:zinc ribbon domain-containing protein [Celeribacter sp.]|uniref:zinc ribbon domain-containing protein n=1 Tax=Celeribacter sp. TaxID=1890673 RepID=UPI003A8F167F
MIPCQSCGMPLTRDPKGGGTEANGLRSLKYCSFCYEDGAFTQDFASPREMQAFCMRMLREQGTWAPVAWLMTRGIPRLERWKKSAASR